MISRSRTRAVVLAFAVLGATTVQAFESMYERTDVGEVEVKNIPALRAVQAEGQGNTFDNIGEPFKILFRYIRKNDYPFTIPIEAETARNVLRIYPTRSLADGDVATGEEVEIVSVPPRTVLSVGLRGSYSRKLYTKGLKELRGWLEENPEWQQTGEPYKVFWDPVWIPGFLKRSEVHIPVKQNTGEDS